jgi:EAL domain-containing protein (putative c-di-GMP-specific phosphodiesterase class I)
VDGIVRLAETLGLRVVAEGIESAADRDLLAEMGCPYGQGFLYSTPLSSAEAARWASGLGTTSSVDEYAHSGAVPAEGRTLPS